MAFRGKWARPVLDVGRETGDASIRTVIEHFTFWDLLVSAFVALPEVPLFRTSEKFGVE